MSSTQADRLRHRHALRLPTHEGARRPARVGQQVLRRPAHGAPRRGVHREHGRGGAGRGGAGALEPPRDLITHTNIRQPPRRRAPSTTPRPSPRARRAPPAGAPGTTLIQRGPRAPIDRRASSLDAAATGKASAGVNGTADATARGRAPRDPPWISEVARRRRRAGPSHHPSRASMSFHLPRLRKRCRLPAMIASAAISALDPPHS